MGRRVLAPLLVLAFLAGGCGTDEGATDEPGQTVSPSGEVAQPQWERIDAEGPSARTDHALAAVGDAVFLFGGRSNRQELGDLWRLDVGTGEWVELQPDGEAPRPRFGPAFEARPDGTLMLFGGERRSAGEFFDDVWSFDPATSRWTELGGAGPAARYGAGSATGPDGTLYVTHGFTGQGRFDDTWSYNGQAFSDRSAAGERPIARCLLQAAHHDGELLIFGGQSNPDPFLNDLWKLDLTEGNWRQLDPETRPEDRNLYAAAQSDRSWWIHGGRGRDGALGDLWRLDLETEEFELLELDGTPSARSGHAAAALSDGLVIFGGAGDQGELGDTWRLRV